MRNVELEMYLFWDSYTHKADIMIYFGRKFWVRMRGRVVDTEWFTMRLST